MSTKTKTKSETMDDMRARHQERLKLLLLTCRSCPQPLGGPYYRKGSRYCIDCELKNESAALMLATKTYAQRNYGNRCETYSPGCYVCRMWAVHDTLENLICD